MAYSRTNLKATVANMVSGEIPDANLSEICNRAVREVVSRVDLRSSIRSTPLAPNLIQQQYEYQCPADLKGISIIDIKPQIGRGRYYKWELTLPEEFDRTKADMLSDNFDARIRQSDLYYGERHDGKVAFEENDMIRKLLISRITDSPTIVINNLEDETEWTAVGDTDAISLDQDNYVSGNASIAFNIDSTGGTTAGIETVEIEFDIEKYLNNGSIYVWAYIVDTTDITDYKLRIGEDAATYYEMTVTKTNDGNAFANGWNLLRFDLSGKSTTGTITETVMEYAALFMTKDTGKTDETGYMFNSLSIGVGKYHRVVYYSKYLWKSAAGARIENSTADTDVLMADTDEIRLIEKKTAAYAEKYLKNHSESSIHEQDYNDAEAQYQIFHTSQALITTKEYYDYGNIQ